MKELEDMGFLCEVVVVDGGSADGTREKAERYTIKGKVHNLKKDVRLESLCENRDTF